MKKLSLLALLAAAPCLFAETDPTPATKSEAPAKINVQGLSTQMIDEVVVPVPNEVFRVLDKLGKPNWNEVLRPMRGVAKAPSGGAEQTSLLLGTVIAEGFIAVEAENAEEVKKIGKSVLNLSRAINVEKAVQRRSQSIIDAADGKDWNKVRVELDGALADVRQAMTLLHSEELSQLVSLGGWIRGTEALTQVVKKRFSKDGAELLHQPMLLDYFEKRISTMDKRRQTALVMQVQKGLIEIRPLMGVADGVDISEKTVNEVGGIAGDLIKAIQSKSN